LDAIAPLAIDAATEAQISVSKAQEDQWQLLELELKQARYHATLAERRYAACDPENRLIAATLEKRWEEALVRVQAFEDRAAETPVLDEAVNPEALSDLAQDLQRAWDAPAVSMRVRQQLLRTLIEDIVADVDDMCSIPDHHIDPRRSAFFMARSVLRDIQNGVQPC
jgi:hypothetical protein